MTVEAPPERVAYDEAVEAAAEAAATLCEAEAAMQKARERYDLMRHRVIRARAAMVQAGCSPFNETYDSRPRFQSYMTRTRWSEDFEDETTD